MSGTYLSLSEYKKMLDEALDDFHKALTRRWMDEAVDAMTNLSPTVPASTEAWAWPVPAESYGHLSGADGEDCGFLTWVMDGQQGHYKDVHCNGWNQQSQKTVECHVERNLAQIDRLAWNRRQEVAKFVPQLEGPDLKKLEAAHNTYLNVAGNLGFQDKNGRVAELLGQREVVQNVQWLAGRTSEHDEWFTEWTGLAAAAFRAGFFASIAPTLQSQSLVLASLSTLYSTRAATIQATRLNIVKWLNWATNKLDDTVTVRAVNLDSQLETVSRTSAAIGIVTSLASATATLLNPVGVALSLVGFVGAIINSATVERNVMSLDEILRGLDTALHEQHIALNDLEQDYYGDVVTLQRAIAGTHSYNLELYDLTANTLPDRTERAKGEGMTVQVPFLLQVAKCCIDAAEAYTTQLRILAEADAADRHLSGRDGETCSGDDKTLEIRDAVEQFMRTSCARFQLAGEQVRNAAQAYAEKEGELTDKLRALFTAWDTATEEDRKRIDPNPQTPEKESAAKEADGTDRTNLEPRKPSEPNSTDPYEKDRQKQGGDYVMDKK